MLYSLLFYQIETGEDPTLEGLEDVTKLKRAWNAARDLCVTIGGDLASFHDPAEDAYIKSLIPMP